MSSTSKNPKAVLANSLTKLVAKHATRAQPAEKKTGTSRQTHKGNPELDAVPDKQNVLSDQTVTAEDYTVLSHQQQIWTKTNNSNNSKLFDITVGGKLKFAR